MLATLKKSRAALYLKKLPKLTVPLTEYHILQTPIRYRETLLEQIQKARHRIYITALYIEKDDAGQAILEAIHQAKQKTPSLDVHILVDWHRAQRGRIGEKNETQNNAQFYRTLNERFSSHELNYFGVPINTREVLGVLHLKGCVIDDNVIYSGASINNVYLHQNALYRFDRYHMIHSKALADSFVDYIQRVLLAHPAVNRLDQETLPTRKQLRSTIKQFRTHLAQMNYTFSESASDDEVNQEAATLQLTPIAGLTKSNPLNQTISHLITITQKKIILCTPYFNFPPNISKSIVQLLRKGRTVEIIVGDKTANDFYIPEDQPFNIVGGLPYLYEMNLRKFAMKHQKYINNGQLVLRLWKDGDNTYHLKGLWVDDEWMLITGNNLNPRGWRLDLENGILIHDPNHHLMVEQNDELDRIRQNTLQVTHYQQIQAFRFYPKPVKTLIKRFSRIKLDRLVKHLL